MDFSQKYFQPPAPYTDELEAGFSKLRFTPKIEQEYLHYLNGSHLRAATTCAIMGATIWLIFIFYDFLRINSLGPHAFADPVVRAWVTCRLSVMVVLIAALVRLNKTREGYHRVISVAFLCCSSGSSFCAAMIALKDLPSAYHFEAIVIMSAFLPLGLTFYQALGMALLAATISITSYSIIHASGDVEFIVRYSIPLLCAIPVGGIGAYLREYAEREQFLYRAIFRHQATIDPLTGIANRRLFEDHTGARLEQASAQTMPVVVALVDIDFFKQFNDTYGHDAGDQAIRFVASKLAENVTRSSDLVARMGGEEFGIFLCDITLPEARRKMQSIIDDIYGARIEHSASPLSHLSVSMGLTVTTGNDQMADLLKQADLALYSAKSSGRNRLVVADESEEFLYVISGGGHA